MTTKTTGETIVDEPSQQAEAATPNAYSHGFRKLMGAFVETDGTDAAAPTYGSPFSFRGEINMSLSDSSSSTPVYAGDETYDELEGVPSLSGTLEVYGELPPEVERDMLGHVADAAGNVSLGEGGVRKPFALMYQVQGKTEPVDWVFYKMKVTKECDVNPETDQETASPKSTVYNVKAFLQNWKGQKYTWTRVKKSTDPTGFASFFTKVHDPTTKAQA